MRNAKTGNRSNFIKKKYIRKPIFWKGKFGGERGQGNKEVIQGGGGKVKNAFVLERKAEIF